jgi:hypothetical protein
MPFKYGIATMTSTPHAFARLHVEIDGRRSFGIAADHLPPKWFTKEPARPVGEECHEMLAVIEQAVGLAADVEAPTAFDAWRQVRDAQADWGGRQGLPPLLTQFGTSLVERALIEAVCRDAGRPFHELLRANAFRIRLGDIHPELDGREPRDFVSEAPLTYIGARHTVGLADPLGDADLPAGERLDDGLPQSLEACVRTYRLRQFKVKVSGDLQRDRERLRRVASVILAGADLFSLDGNEQFHDLDAFRAFWHEITGDEALRPLFALPHWVEQPLHRSVALDPEVARLHDWPQRPPIIIDESDEAPDSFRRALALGYAGTSHKNCKGVFKSVAHRCLALHLSQSRRDGPPLLLTGEDLANIGPVALLQDLTVCAALGIDSVERNGHHYFAGLSMFPADVQRQVLEHHGDLYHASGAGWPTLAVEQGRVKVGSLLRAPLGVGFVAPVERFLSPDAWRRANPL